MALPCVSAKRSRLFLEVFDDCSYVRCKLSPRGWAIVRELNDQVLLLISWRRAEKVILSHAKRWVHHIVHTTCITCTPMTPLCYL